MQHMLRRNRQVTEERESGFTLMELLIVVVIIGVLVGISIPLYMNYRKGAENKSAMTDVRGAIGAVEQYYTENANTYPASASGTGANIDLGGGLKITVSTGNTINYVLSGSDYWICGQNSSGGTVYVYKQSVGAGVKKAGGTWANCVSTGT